MKALSLTIQKLWQCKSFCRQTKMTLKTDLDLDNDLELDANRKVLSQGILM